jgi:hypothetical protein
VDAIRRFASSGPDVDAAFGAAREERGRHLAPPGVVDADEEHGGLIGHEFSVRGSDERVVNPSLDFPPCRSRMS